MHFILSSLFSVSRKCASAKCNIIPITSSTASAAAFVVVVVVVVVWTLYSVVYHTESHYIFQHGITIWAPKDRERITTAITIHNICTVYTKILNYEILPYKPTVIVIGVWYKYVLQSHVKIFVCVCSWILNIGNSMECENSNCIYVWISAVFFIFMYACKWKSKLKIQ